jgi:hypothetical protein
MPTFDTPEPITVSIELSAGFVRIVASDRADTVVHVRPSNESRDGDVQAADQTKVDYVAGQLSVATPKPWTRFVLGRPPSIDVTIELPTGSNVDVRGVLNLLSLRGEGRIGDVTIATGGGSTRLEQAGRLNLRTGVGDIWVGRATGHIDVSTSTGKIQIGEITGGGTVKSPNGPITIGEITEHTRLNSANSEIIIDHVRADIAAKTAHGAVRIGEVVRGKVDIETHTGEVELGIREGTAAFLDVASKRGTVRNDLAAADGPGQSDETAEVRVGTVWGDVAIRRS